MRQSGQCLVLHPDSLVSLLHKPPMTCAQMGQVACQVQDSVKAWTGWLMMDAPARTAANVQLQLVEDPRPAARRMPLTLAKGVSARLKPSRIREKNSKSAKGHGHEYPHGSLGTIALHVNWSAPQNWPGSCRHQPVEALPGHHLIASTTAAVSRAQLLHGLYPCKTQLWFFRQSEL